MTNKIQQIREAIAVKRRRQQFIESLGDTDLDWMGYDSIDDIIEHLDWAIANGKGDNWAKHFGGKLALMEHINGYRKSI